MVISLHSEHARTGVTGTWATGTGTGFTGVTGTGATGTVPTETGVTGTGATGTTEDRGLHHVRGTVMSCV